MTTTEQTNHYISYQLDQIPFTLAGSFLTTHRRAQLLRQPAPALPHRQRQSCHPPGHALQRPRFL